MSAKQSAETRYAVGLYVGGMPVYRACKEAGIVPSTLYRLLNSLKKLKKKKKIKKKVARRIA